MIICHLFCYLVSKKNKIDKNADVYNMPTTNYINKQRKNRFIDSHTETYKHTQRIVIQKEVITTVCNVSISLAFSFGKQKYKYIYIILIFFSQLFWLNDW